MDLPGDNLNLYAVLKSFQESETLEGFERTLNDESGKINNLDLDGDGKTDYILLGSAIVDNDDPAQKPGSVEKAQIHLAVISNPDNQFFTAKEMRADPFIDPSKSEFPPESKGDDKLTDEEASSIVTFLKSLKGEIPTEYIAQPKLPESGPKTPKA